MKNNYEPETSSQTFLLDDSFESGNQDSDESTRNKKNYGDNRVESEWAQRRVETSGIQSFVK